MLLRIALAACLALFAAPLRADPGYYVVAPYDRAGTWTLDAMYWTVRSDTRGEQVWPELGLGRGVTSRWATGLRYSAIGPANLRTRSSTLNWQHTLLLTQGNWPLDVALYLQWVRDLRDSAHAREHGLLLQGDIGRTQWNLNTVWERVPRAGSHQTRLKLQWQLRHRWQPGLQVGIVGFDELGPWDHWLPHSRQSHRAGPALHLAWPEDDLELSAAWLLGRTYGRSGHMATLRLARHF
jgi:hypothetical protein